jgi:hypothetical protein
MDGLLCMCNLFVTARIYQEACREEKVKRFKKIQQQQKKIMSEESEAMPD